MHKHRHLVAFPLFVAMVGLSLIPFEPRTTTAQQVVGIDTHFTLEGDVSGMLYGGVVSSQSDAVFLRGEATIASKGSTTINTNMAQLTLISGAAYVSAQDTALTVAALTAPVVVFIGDMRMVVPTGMQWSLTDDGMASMTDGFQKWVAARTPLLLPQNFIERKRADLLQEVDDLPEIESDTLTEAMWMALSFHPKYQERIWSVTAPEVSVEALATRAFLLPLSTLTTDEFSSFLADRYTAQLFSVNEVVGDETSFIEYVVGAYLPHVSRLDDAGFPLRAAHLKDTIIALINASDTVTESMANVLHTLKRYEEIDVSSLPLPSEEDQDVPNDEPAEPSVVLSPSEVEAKAYDMLAKTPALFSVQTTVAATGPNEATVQHLLFSGASEDRSVSFTLNVVTGVVSDIEVNNETGYPYEPTFDGFITWISK